MSELAIKVEGLGKKYVIGQQKSGDFRNAFGEKLKSLLGRNGSGAEQEFWALQDINFEIKKGEAVGIIGRNGAGKSTLLKILSRITEPTKGRFEINGRVSSLLEVGTGFHMELTGRENIYLNGTILGMKRREIKAKFDKIVAFSGVEKFIDTPVKHYSSGMKVRLAFSVAAHLEPEILIIDEVLAVGDAEFQKKCLGKMDDVSKNEGRTVIFVSHNMSAIKSFCSDSVVLCSGRKRFFGKTEESVNIYLEDVNKATSKGGEVTWNINNAPGIDEFKLLAVRVKDNRDEVSSVISSESEIRLEVEYLLETEVQGMRLNFRLLTFDDQILFASSTEMVEARKKDKGVYKCLASFPKELLNNGAYKVFVQAGCPGVKELLKGNTFLEFEIKKLTPSGMSDALVLPGYISPKVDWQILKLDERVN
jgi:lipopolysaccharide transport system ATP-binding protein